VSQQEGGVKAGPDIRSKPLEALSWDLSTVLASLARLVNHAIVEAETAIDWYLGAKRSKQHLARWLRAGAILLTATAGVIPILTQIYATDGKPAFSPAWASFALAVAATLVGLDRFFGFSSAWIRYITTEMRIRRILQGFRLDWETDKATWKGETPNDEQIQRVLARVKAFVLDVATIVEAETNSWAEEFQSTLKQIEEAAKAKAEATALGGVNVTVTNGSQCDGGWQLIVDEGAGRRYSGTTAAISGLIAGQHVVRVEGTIGGHVRRAEKVVTVAAGPPASIELTLA
jgi:hypothetical protein